MTPIELMNWADRIERTQPVTAALARAEAWRSDPELVEHWRSRGRGTPATLLTEGTGDVKP